MAPDQSQITLPPPDWISMPLGPAVGPDALARRRVGGAGPDRRPLERRGGFAAGRRAGRQGPWQ